MVHISVLRSRFPSLPDIEGLYFELFTEASKMNFFRSFFLEGYLCDSFLVKSFDMIYFYAMSGKTVEPVESSIVVYIFLYTIGSMPKIMIFDEKS